MTDVEPLHCAYHHRTPAVATCSVCGNGVCGVCVTTANSAAYCSGCGVGRETQKSWLAESRTQAEQRLLAETQQLGADAVVNIRDTASAVMQGMAEMPAYGTTVKLERA